jgi:hypothetical protein
VVVDEPQGFSSSIPTVWDVTCPALAIFELTVELRRALRALVGGEAGQQEQARKRAARKLTIAARTIGNAVALVRAATKD